VTSAYRNPERNEAIGGAATSNHMLGRALDIGFNNTGPSGDLDRGVAFYKAWRTVHGANPGDTGYQNAPSRFKGTSANVPTADYWQLEGAGGPTDVILASHYTGFPKLSDKKDSNKNGILDGYDRTFHLHIADRPVYGAHK
jgi:hypothetical protein